MKILFLHGLESLPGGSKVEYLQGLGHTVLNPLLPKNDFEESVRIAQDEVDVGDPDLIVGSSRGGAVAMAIDPGRARLILIAPAWKRFEIPPSAPAGTDVLHCTNDDQVLFQDSQKLQGANLVPCGDDHRMADEDALAALGRAVGGNLQIEVLVRKYIRTLLIEQAGELNVRLNPKSSTEYFRVEATQSKDGISTPIGYAEGSERLNAKGCEADVEKLKQSPEYLDAEEKYVSNPKNRRKDMKQDDAGKYYMEEVEGKFRPRMFSVNNAWIHKAEERGKGYGKEIYKAFIDQAKEYAKSYGGVFIVSDFCGSGISGATSSDAKRIWGSLGRDYLSSGQVIFIGL